MSDVPVRAIAAPNVTTDLLDVFTPLVDEAKLHFNDDGITTSAVDPANVAMHHVTLDASAFESWESPGAVTIAADLGTLTDKLGVYDTGDVLDMSINMESRKLQLTDGSINQRVALIDPDAVRGEPDVPDLDLPNTAVLTGAQLATIDDVVSLVSDHVEIGGDPDGRAVTFLADGDIDDSDVTFGEDDALEGTKVTTDASALVSHDYFQKVVKPIPKQAEVTILWGSDMPVRLQWTGLEGHLHVSTTIAPRIQSD